MNSDTHRSLGYPCNGSLIGHITNTSFHPSVFSSFRPFTSSLNFRRSDFEPHTYQDPYSFFMMRDIHIYVRTYTHEPIPPPSLPSLSRCVRRVQCLCGQRRRDLHLLWHGLLRSPPPPPLSSFLPSYFSASFPSSLLSLTPPSPVLLSVLSFRPSLPPFLPS
jgi:hypothetical protein